MSKNDEIFKVGDKVFDHLFGHGEVIKVYSGYSEYPISVAFKEAVHLYTAYGRYIDKANPTLSLTEYKLDGFSQDKTNK